VAPSFVLSLVLLPVLGWWWPVASWLLAAGLLMYLILAFYFAAKISRNEDNRFALMLLIPVVFFVLHVTWGVSFLLSVIQPSYKERPI